MTAVSNRLRSSAPLLAPALFLLLARFDPTGGIYYPDGRVLDAGMVASALGHAVLGLAKLWALLVCGFALLALLTRPGRRPPPWDALVLAAGLGAAGLLALTVLALALPFGRMLSLALLAAGQVFLLRRRPFPWHGFPAASDALRRILPVALFLGLVAGLLWSPPQPGFTSCLLGDMFYYAGNAEAMAARFPGTPNFMREGEFLSFVQGFDTAFAALLLPLPGVEAASFFAAGNVAFAAGALGLLVRGLAGRRGEPLPAGAALLAALLVAAAARFPSWLVSSPPAVTALLLPLPLAVFLSRPGLGLRHTLPLLALTSLLCAVAKITFLAFLGAWIGLVILTQLWRGGGAVARLATLALLAVAALAALAYARRVLPYMTTPQGFGPDSFHIVWAAWWAEPGRAALFLREGFPALCRDAGIGLTVLTLLAWRRDPASLAALAGLAFFAWHPWIFYVYPLGLFLLAAFRVFESGPPPRAVAAGLAAGALLMLVQVAGADTAGPWWGLLWVLTLGGLVAGLAGRPLAPASAAPGLLLAAALAVAVASGAHAVPNLSRLRMGPENRVSHDYVDALRQLPRLTPPDTLVFTDQTGEDTAFTRGWNCLPPFGRRQHFLAGWMQTSLRTKPEERARLLELNRRVLAGEVPPRDAPASRPHSSFHGLVAATHPLPAGARELYRNPGYAIFAFGESPDAP